MRRVLAFLLALAAAPAAQAQVLRPGEPPNGMFANLRLEVVDEAPRAASGPLKKNAIVAQHALRAADAIVLREAATARNLNLPDGLRLARVDFAPSVAGLIEGKGRRVAWCDMRGTGAFSMGRLDCLSDANDDGRLDEHLVGWVGSTSFAFFVEKVGPMGPLAAPVAYRTAEPAERPSTVVGYRVCDLGTATSPPRFAMVAKLGTNQGWSSSSLGDCRFGVWPDPADRARLVVDAIELRVAPAPEPTFELARGLKPGPSGRFVPGGSLERAAEQTTTKAEMQAAIQTLTRSPLRPVGTAEAVGGEVRRGAVLVSVPARHAITGRLRNEVRAKGLLASGATPLPVGQPVYGVTTPYGGLYWCAPRQTEQRWTGVCLPEAGGAARWMTAEPALFPRMLLTLSNYTSGADTPSVELEPFEFGPPMQVEYRYAGGNRRYVQIDVHVRSATGQAQASLLTRARAADGSVDFRLLGGRLKLVPSADMKTVAVSVAEPLKAEGALPF